MTDRTNVGVMMAGQGAVRDVWAATEQFLKERKRKAEARARAARAYSPAQEAARRWAGYSVWGAVYCTRRSTCMDLP